MAASPGVPVLATSTISGWCFVPPRIPTVAYVNLVLKAHAVPFWPPMARPIP